MENVIDAWMQHPRRAFLQHEMLEHLDDLGLDAEARELFLRGNAARVFGI